MNPATSESSVQASQRIRRKRRSGCAPAIRRQWRQCQEKPRPAARDAVRDDISAIRTVGTARTMRRSRRAGALHRSGAPVYKSLWCCEPNPVSTHGTAGITTTRGIRPSETAGEAKSVCVGLCRKRSDAAMTVA